MLNLLLGANSSIDNHHGHQRLTTATLSFLLKFLSGEECQSLESWIKTDPALAFIWVSPWIGAVKVILSFGPLGFLLSLCEPGTAQVPPDFSSTSFK